MALVNEHFGKIFNDVLSSARTKPVFLSFENKEH